MTVDVEDYFQVQAFANRIDRGSWDLMPSRVEANMDMILAQFAEADVRATFFTLGWVGARFPTLVRRIVAEGHELASHGDGHELVTRLTPSQYRNDLIRAKGVLEDAGGVAVQGYRAPTFSIGAENLWAFDVLAETGHRYSSSVYPIRHDLYGMPQAPRFGYRAGQSGLVELPMTTLRLGSRNWPIAGGGYFRLMPYELYKRALKRFHQSERRPSIFYFHPWEIDAEQPPVRGVNWRARFRHYVNIRAMPTRLKRLLRDFSWARMDEVFASDLKRLAA